MTLFKFGDFDLTKYILADSYDILPNQRIDKDSYNDSEGILHRTALKHTVTSITFNLQDVTFAEMQEIMQGIVRNYIDFEQRDAMCEYFDTETFTVKTGHFYLDPSFKHRIKEINKNGELEFGQTAFKFTEY